MDYCCEKFKEMAGALGALAGGGFLNPPELMPNAQFEPSKESPTWNINGCCGGGCFVVTEMRFCPYCGQSLKHPTQPPMPYLEFGPPEGEDSGKQTEGP